MIFVTIVIGILFSAILIIHTFITGNALEKNCIDLKDSIEKYYKKEETVMAEERG